MSQTKHLLEFAQFLEDQEDHSEELYSVLTNNKITMSNLIAKESGNGDFEPIQQGTHMARCIRVYDLGTQQNVMYNNSSHKVMLVFEIPDSPIENKDGDIMPMLQSKEYTLSLAEKANLRRDLISWRGKDFTAEEAAGFDIAKVLGVPCMLSIIHKKNEKTGKTYANIGSIIKPMKGAECPLAAHKMFIYEIAEGATTTFNQIPEWIQKKISQAEEWSPVAGFKQTPPDDSMLIPAGEEYDIPDDSLPF